MSTNASPENWSDDHLAHMCSLSAVVVSMIREDDFDPTDIGDEPLQNMVNMYQILADTFVALQSRAGLKQKFRVQQPQ